MYDYLIVGAGLSGCILAERIANQLDKKVLIVEKRNNLAGNLYDYVNENGIMVHKHGPHIFHTNNKKVWDYLSLFTAWNSYEHKVLANFDGIKAPIPFNLNSIDICFGRDNILAEKLKNKLIKNYGLNKKIHILEIINHKDKDICNLAEYIYQNIFLKYTAKQWGCRLEELNKSVTSRLPLFVGYDTRYFQDTYQGIPSAGYTKMIENMIANPKISLIMGTDYKEIINDVKFGKMVYTGPIDYFFDYQYGELPYRSLNFKYRNFEKEYFQETAQINFTKHKQYTRIVEFKHLTGQKTKGTTICYEYPVKYIAGVNEPYYPVPKKINDEIFCKYKMMAKQLTSVILCGRLADYKYYNMDQITARALHIFNSKILPN